MRKDTEKKREEKQGGAIAFIFLRKKQRHTPLFLRRVYA